MTVIVECVDVPDRDVCELLSELDAVLGAAYPPEQRHALSLDQLFQPNIRFFIARLKGEAVGCGGVALLDGFAEVKRMYSRPAVRGRGVAKALLGQIEHEAKAAGYRQLRLETGIYQPEAIGLYRRCGFHPCQPFGHYAELPLHTIATSLFFEKQL